MSAELAAAGILAAGSYGARRLFQYQKKMGYGNSTRPVLTNKTDENAVNIYRLRRMVLAQRPQISNWPDTATVNCTAVSVTPIDYNLTNRFVTSTGAGSYNDLVLGDKFRNIKSHFRFDYSIGMSRVRVVLYWSKKAGNTCLINDYTTIADPTAFTVVYDQTWSPQGASANVCNTVKSAVINHRGKITNYNESSSIIEQGELHLRIIAENPTSSNQTFIWVHRFYLRNK